MRERLLVRDQQPSFLCRRYKAIVARTKDTLSLCQCEHDSIENPHACRSCEGFIFAFASADKNLDRSPALSIVYETFAAPT